MGVEGLVGGLFGLASAGVQAASASHVQSANAAAQADINAKTMKFNRAEAKKARDFQAAQAVLDRNYNSAEAVKARQFQTQQVNQAQDFSAQQAEITRQFEERMSSTAHQREVNDLYAAGLNPILSANSGAAAMSAPAASGVIGSAPAASHNTSGAAAAMVSGLSAYQRKNIVGEFVSTAMEGLRLDNDLRRAKAADLNAQANMKHAEAHETEAQTGVKAQAASEREIDKRIEKIDTDIDIAFKDYNIREKLANASIEEKHAVIDELYSRIGVNDAMAEKLGMEKREVEKRVRYGAFFATYLPEKVGKWFEENILSFTTKHPDVMSFFVDKCDGDITDPQKGAKAAVETYEKFKDLFGGND